MIKPDTITITMTKAHKGKHYACTQAFDLNNMRLTIPEEGIVMAICVRATEDKLAEYIQSETKWSLGARRSEKSSKQLIK